MKKFRMLIFVLMLGAVVFAACAPQAAEAPAEGKDLVFASVVKSIGDTWFVRFEEGVLQFGEDFGVTSFMEGPSQPDSAAQVAIIDDLIAQGVDVIVNIPYGVVENEAAQKKAMDAGIIVIGHEAETANADTLHYDLEGFEVCAAGEEEMRDLAEAMGEEGQYAQFVGSLTNASHNIWTDCGKAYQEANFPNMEWVGKFESKESAENGYNMMKDLLKTYPEIKGIQSTDSVEIQGIGRAIEEAGLQDQIMAIGTCIVGDVGDLLQSGAVDMCMIWDPKDAAYASLVVGMKILNGEEITAGMDLGVPGYENVSIRDGENGAKVIVGNAWAKITKDNMDEMNF
jgi:simple sugar transport system substrate-binding protein